MNEISKLLEEVSWFNKIKKLKVEKSDDQFNMFRICGVNHYENTHSSIIAELLNPNATHQFNHLFLESFIQALIFSKVLPADYEFKYENVQVKKEHPTSFGRLDILLTNSENEAILIENKIYAADQFEQLKRYSDYGKQTFADKFKLLYLTLWGNESQAATVSNVEYVQVSYCDTVLQWLDRCVEIAARSPVVRETLIQYSNHLKNLTNSNTNAIMDQELINKLSTLENLDSVFKIADNVDNVKNNIINTVFLKQLKEIGEELNLNSLSEKGEFVNSSWAGFSFSNPDWRNFNVFMEFSAKGLRNLIIGISSKNDQVDISSLPLIKEKIGGGNGRAAFVRFPTYPNWDVDAMKAIMNGDMKDIVKNKIIDLIEITRGVENL